MSIEKAGWVIYCGDFTSLDVPNVKDQTTQRAPRRPMLTLFGILASVGGFILYARVEGASFLIGWVALVPWLATLDSMRTMRQALFAGLAMCVAFTTGVFFWFAQAMQGYTGASLPLTVLVLIALAPILQPQIIAFAVARVSTRDLPRGHRAFVGAGMYVGSEWLLPKLLGDTLGHGLFASPWLRQAADIAGAPGLTFLLILANECMLAILCALKEWTSGRSRSRSAVLVPTLCLVSLVSTQCLYGAMRLRQVQAAAATATLDVAIAQANISNYSQLAKQMSTYDAVRMILDSHLALSTQALADGHLDLLVWPETMYPTTFGSPKSEDGAAFDREIAGLTASAGVPLMFGSYDVENGHEFNAAVLLEPSPDGRIVFDTYRKMRLFPFTERVPMLLDRPAVRAWFPWLGTWTAGSGPPTLTLHRPNDRSVQLAPLICFDAVDPTLAIQAVREGAETLVVLSNDAWFAEEGGPHLHLVVSAFRSIETRRPQIRSTTTGISAVISATGDIVDRVGVRERGILRTTIRSSNRIGSLMLAWGDWFGPVALLIGGAFLTTGRWQQMPR